MKRISTFFFLVFLSLTFAANAQLRDISGKVTVAEDGSTLPGVSVRLKGTNAGATTDANGMYRIQVPGNSAVLVFSFIGFTAKEVTVGGQSTINLALSADSKTLDEVIITTQLGIARQQKSLGYAAQGVNSEELNVNRQSNLLNALQGKVAGATISSVGGGPGQGANIRIRGINSIDASSSNDPLYVIDGIQVDNSTSTQGAGSGNNVRSVGNRISDINPDEIESINILKGGAATALYGLRGANGVVVITTKKGTGVGIRTTFTSTYGVENINKTPDVQTEYTAGILGTYTPIGLGPAWGPTIAEAKAIDPTHPDKLFENYKNAFDTDLRSEIHFHLPGDQKILNSSLLYRSLIMMACCLSLITKTLEHG